MQVLILRSISNLLASLVSFQSKDQAIIQCKKPRGRKRAIIEAKSSIDILMASFVSRG